jgi:hypothetical protein
MSDWWASDPVVTPAARGAAGEQWWAADPIVKEAPRRDATVDRMVEGAIEPITSIPATYQKMVNEGVERMGRGAQQFTSGDAPRRFIPSLASRSASPLANWLAVKLSANMDRKPRKVPKKSKS